MSEPGPGGPAVSGLRSSADSEVETTEQRTTEDTASRPDPASRNGAAFHLDTRLLALVGVLGVLLVVGLITTQGNFLSESNLSIMLRQAAAIGVVSVGMTFVIISGGIDLSVGSILALSSVWMTTLATQSYGPWVMVLCALLVGLGCGLVNGVLIAYGNVVPFIATLAMFVAARGLAERLSGRRTQVVGDTGFLTFFRGDLLGIPVLIIMLAVVFAIGWVVLNRTTFGRRTFAVGGNAEAARLAGINIKWHTALVYGIAGLCCGIAAIMVVARTTSGASTNGTLYELDAIAAVVIGGTLLTGGRGTMIGTLIGVLIFSVLNSIFTQNHLETDIQQIAKGVIIVAAVLLQQFGGTRRRKT
ncbi:ABC transporter permease [Actinophytocola sp.]|uniref:ABC transporter permease n=1 Tax=Actinophytocola sp. TaxID=1872138 RepID=UPI002D7F9453|nr:ABC transporter permease [Actinophytocola sp.]HET9137963.1 ABC transporter permease [Actinophytocola sp.]